MLFRAYCSPIYGCQLWSTMFQYSYSKLRVAYNDAFRQLLHEPRWCSASRLFVFHNVSSFSAIIRKLVYSLLCSLRDSNNLLVCAMLHSDYVCNHLCLRDGISCYMYFSSSFFLIVFNHSLLYIFSKHGLWACYWNKLNWIESTFQWMVVNQWRVWSKIRLFEVFL